MSSYNKGLNTNRSPLSTSVTRGLEPAGQASASSFRAVYSPPNPPPSTQTRGPVAPGKGAAASLLDARAEVEVERKRNAANFYGFGYDLVKLTGELKIRNLLAKPISLEITKELSGEVLEKAASPQDVQTAKGLKQINPKHVLTWMSTLKAGEELKITYSYQLYIRP